MKEESTFKLKTDLQYKVGSGMTNDPLRSSEHEVCQNEPAYGKRTRDGVEPRRQKEREYVARNSLLTDMLELSQIRTIYNMFLASLVVLALLYTLKFGRLDLGIEFIVWNFGNLSSGICIWVYMTSAIILVYECFYCWATRRALFAPDSLALKCWDCFWLSAFVFYQLCFFIMPAAYIFERQLAPATTLAVTFEQLRMMMKSHAFVRSNVPRVTAHKISSETSSPPCPKISQFIYFLYSPTLVYRDIYPRTECIRWHVVAHHLLEMVGIVFYQGFIIQLWVNPTYREWGLHPVTLRQAFYMVASTFIPVCVAFLVAFYMFSHVWPNIGAEVMRFADRRFYDDWWNAQGGGELFRKWNLLIQDWLYAYVYLELRTISSSALVRNLTVFVISGLGHEYFFGMTFGYYHTAMPLLSAIITALYLMANLPCCRFISKNVVVWTLISVAMGSFTSLHAMERFARINCVQTQEGWADFFSFPRSLNCIPNNL